MRRTRPNPAPVRNRNLCLALLLAATLAGCSTPPPAVVVPREPIAFDQAAAVAADALMQQGDTGGGLFARASRRAVALDLALDADSGQQTAATQRLDRAIAARLGQEAEKVELLPFDSSGLSKAQYLLTASMTRAEGAYRVDLALVDIRAATVIAQSSALARKDGVDISPLAYDRDSPVLVKDKILDGHVKTSRTPVGQKADPIYLDRIATAAVVNDATALYNSGRYADALARYRSALGNPAGEQLKVLNGIYLSTVKLGQAAEAEEAFGKVVSFGIAYRQLGVKFLFSPGSTDFWPDPRVSSAYGMWLRQIARQGAAARVCMEIVGHTSKTGPEAVNDSLSLRRAVYIRQRLNAESPAMATRTRAQGMGSRQNIVGSGSDDVVDALDRRVEFTIAECAG